MFVNPRELVVIAALCATLGCGGGSGSSAPQQPPAKQWTQGSVLDTNYIFANSLRDQFYAADSAGNRLLLLLQSENATPRLYARYYSANTKSWSSSQPIQASGTYGDFPTLLMSSNGQGFAAWRQNPGTDSLLMISNFDPISGWSSPRTIASGIRDYQLACRGEKAVLLWTSLASDNHLYACHYSTTTGWGAIEALSSSPGTTINQFRISVNPTGNCVAVWEEDPNSDSYYIQASDYSPNTGWGVPVHLNVSPVPGTAGYFPRLAMKDTGETLVTWAQYQNSYYTPVPIGTYYRIYTPGVGWGSAQFAIQDVIDTLTINAKGLVVSTGLTPNPRLGNATFSIQTAFFNANHWASKGALSAPSTTGLYSNPPSLAVDSSGDFILAFLGQQPSPSGAYDAWYSRFSVSSQSWLTPSKFPGQLSSDINGIQVIALPNGEVSAIWLPRLTYGVVISEHKSQ